MVERIFTCPSCNCRITWVDDVARCLNADCPAKKVKVQEFTFVVDLDVNDGSGKGINRVECVVYRSGADFNEALGRARKDFAEPRILFAAAGRLEPLRGLRTDDVQWQPECQYSFSE